MEIWDGIIFMKCIIAGLDRIMDGRLQDFAIVNRRQLIFLIFLYIMTLKCILHYFHLYHGIMNWSMFM